MRRTGGDGIDPEGEGRESIRKGGEGIDPGGEESIRKGRGLIGEGREGYLQHSSNFPSRLPSLQT